VHVEKHNVWNRGVENKMISGRQIEHAPGPLARQGDLIEVAEKCN
jgi:hypothetical protein